MESGARDIVVTVPADPDYVHIVRSAVAGVAARLDFPVDSIEDLKLAVGEASAHLLDAVPDARSLTVRIAAAGSRVEVEASVEGASVPWPPDGVEGSLAWQVLSALTEDTRFESSSDGGPGIRFAVGPPR